MGFGGLIFLLVCAVIALETPAGKKFIVRKVEKSANALLTGRLKIGALRGNLITGMTIEKIGLRDQSGRAVLDVATTHLAYRIRPFRPFVIFNEVDIQGVQAHRHIDAKGVSNWDHLVRPSQEPSRKEESESQSPAVQVKNLKLSDAKFTQTVAEKIVLALKSIEVEMAIPEVLDQLPEGKVTASGHYQGRPLSLDSEVKSTVEARTSEPHAQAVSLDAKLGTSQVKGLGSGIFRLKNWVESSVSVQLPDFHVNTADFSAKPKPGSKAGVPTIIDGDSSLKLEDKKLENKTAIGIQENGRRASQIVWEFQTSHLTDFSSLELKKFQWLAHCPLLKLDQPTTLTLNRDDYLPMGDIRLKGCVGSVNYLRSNQGDGPVRAVVDNLQLGPIMNALGLPRQRGDKGRIDLNLHLPQGVKKTIASVKASLDLPHSLFGSATTLHLNADLDEHKAIGKVSAAVGEQKVSGNFALNEPFIKPWEVNKENASGTFVLIAKALDLKKLHESGLLTTDVLGTVQVKLNGSASANHAKLFLESYGNKISIPNGSPEGVTPPLNYKALFTYDERELNVRGNVQPSPAGKELVFQANMKAPFLKIKNEGLAAIKKFPIQWNFQVSEFDLWPYLFTTPNPALRREKISLTAKGNGKGSIEDPQANLDAAIQIGNGPVANVVALIKDQYFRATLKAHDASLDTVIPLFTPYVTLRNSKFNANLIASGPVSDVVFHGNLSLVASEIVAPSFQINYTEPSLHIEGQGHQINLTKLHLKGGDGSLDGTGSVGVRNSTELTRAHFKARFRKFAIISNDKMSIVSTGDIGLNANHADSTFGGEILISEAKITLPENNQKKTLEPLGDFKDVVVKQEVAAESSSEPRSLFTDLSGTIHIKAPGRVWIKGPDVAVDLKADLFAGLNEDQEMFVRGNVKAQRGFVEVFGRHLELRKANVELMGDPSNPRVDVVAMYHYSPKNIIVALQGPKETLKPKLYSEPPGYSEDECIAVLLTGSPNYQGGGGGGSVGGMASGFVVGQLKKKLGPKLPVDTITADLPSEDQKKSTTPAKDRDKKANLEVGKYISDRAFLKVGRAFTTQQSGAVNMITLDYRLSEKWSFETKQTDGGRSDVGFQWTVNY